MQVRSPLADVSVRWRYTASPTPPSRRRHDDIGTPQLLLQWPVVVQVLEVSVCRLEQLQVAIQ